MRIRQGPDHNSLELHSGTATVFQMVFGLGFGVVGFLFAASVTSTIFFSHRATGMSSDPWWVLLLPLIFLIVGISVAGSGAKIPTRLQRFGPSEVHTRQWFGLKRNDETFDAAHGHHLALHTDERIRRNKNGSTRYRISTLALVTRDGAEVVIGKQQRSGLGGNQPLLEQAGELSHFLGLPLERTGYGAPVGYDIPPDGFTGAPQPPHSGFHHGGQPPQAGGGLPNWVRGEGNHS